MVSFKSRWLDWKPEIPNYRTDNADKSPSVSAVSSIPKDSAPESTDLTEVIPARDGTPLEQLAYEVRDKKLISERRTKAVEISSIRQNLRRRSCATDVALQ